MIVVLGFVIGCVLSEWLDLFVCLVCRNALCIGKFPLYMYVVGHNGCLLLLFSKQTYFHYL